MPKAFRSTPPIELVVAFLQTLNLKGVQDATWFSKSCIHLPTMEALLPELEPYYYPCKAQAMLIPFTQVKGITIIRQLLHAHGINVKSQEKTIGCVKGTWYQIATSAHEVTVDFT